MNILFLTSRFPYPPHRGDKLKMYNLLKRLSRRHAITLLSFVSGARDLSYVGDIEQLGVRVETVRLPMWRSLLSSLLALTGSDPLQVRYYASRTMRARLRTLLMEKEYDVVHVHLIRMAQYCRSDRSRARVLDLTDAGSLYLERFHRTTRNPVKKFLLGIELKRLRLYEAVIGEFSASLVCSSVDLDVLAARAKDANLSVLLNGIDLEYFTPGVDRISDPLRIIYTGNLSYFPNSDGVLFFVRNVFPLIKKENPGVTLYIVGKDPPKGEKTGLVQYRRHRLRGGYPHGIPQEFRRDRAHPVRCVHIDKVLEPMALGIPVVATSVGAEGLLLESGRHLLVADTAAEFASCVNRLLASERLRSELGENAMRIVRARHDWDVVTDSLEKIYRQCAGTGARPVNRGPRFSEVVTDFLTINLAWSVYYLVRVRSGIVSTTIEPDFLVPMLAVWVYWTSSSSCSASTGRGTASPASTSWRPSSGRRSSACCSSSSSSSSTTRASAGRSTRASSFWSTGC